MEDVNITYGSFGINFKDGSDTWYLAIHPEMYPAKEGIKPAGSYFIFCIHPSRGSMSLIVEQDENYRWFSERRPPFISEAFIEWVGKQIELQDRYHCDYPAQ